MIADFPDTAPDEWWQQLPQYQVDIIREMLASGLTEEEAAELWLSRTGPDNNFAFGTSRSGTNFLNSVKAEFRKLMCGDPAYDKVRAEASAVWKGAKIPVVSAIAAAIATTIGVAAAVIMPVVALLLAAVAKVGLNAWCNMPAPPPPTVIDQ